MTITHILLDRKVIFYLIIFSVCYWYCAIIKPFPTDSYYSWVYAKNCTFSEILSLKDSGIGHPPLFHLLQKMVQTILPGYHAFYIRIVNFFAGIIFFYLLITYLKKYQIHNLYLFSLVISATLMDIFIYARMWGIAVLVSFILYITGEKYVETLSDRYLLYSILLFGFGMFADYNFILMLPYFFIIITKKNRFRKYLFYYACVFLVIVIISIYAYNLYKQGLTDTIYSFINAFISLSFLHFQNLVNFDYMESILFALFIILIYLFFTYNREEINNTHHILWFLSGITILYFAINLDLIRIRVILILLPIFIYYIYYILKKIRIENIWEDIDTRIIASITIGSIILLAINPIFWRSLLESRFIIVLFPMFIVLVYRNFSYSFLSLIAVIVIISGILYMASARVSNSFPAGVIDYNKPNIYGSPRAYATQYLKNWKKGDVPMFLSMKSFDKSCRICKEVMRKNTFGLTEIDKFQIEYLTPIKENHFYVYEIKKIKTNEE